MAVLFLVAYIVELRTLDGPARWVPAVVGIVTLVIAARNALIELSVYREGPPSSRGVSKGSVARWSAVETRQLGWTVGATAGVLLFGLLPTTALYMVGYLRLEAKLPWRLILVLAGTYLLFVYVLFVQVIGVDWHGGVIPGRRIIW